MNVYYGGSYLIPLLPNTGLQPWYPFPEPIVAKEWKLFNPIVAQQWNSVVLLNELKISRWYQIKRLSFVHGRFYCVSTCFQGVLVEEVDEGRPCLTCREKCSGFAPHLWRWVRTSFHARIFCCGISDAAHWRGIEGTFVVCHHCVVFKSTVRPVV